MVDVKKAGTYRFTLRQLPEAAGATLKAVRAKIEIAGATHEQAISTESESVVFTMKLPAGKTELVTYFYDEKGTYGGAYFTEVEAL